VKTRTTTARKPEKKTRTTAVLERRANRVETKHAETDPISPVEQVVQETYRSLAGGWLARDQIRQITEAFSAYEGFLQSPKSFCVQVFDHANDDNHAVFPFYALELRGILRDRKITGLSKLVGFGYHASKRVLKDFTALVVIDCKKLGVPFRKLRGVILFDATELELGDSVVRVLSQARLDSRENAAVEKIVREEYPRASVHSVVELPGIAVPKVTEAQSVPPKPQLEKYVVNIPRLGINHERHNAASDEEAVQKALDAAWRASGNPHRGAEYVPETYRQWWSMIVRKASAGQLGKYGQLLDDGIQVKLTPTEQKIFDFLLKVNEKYNLGLTFRVAGGWVRDKALGKESDDIDIALDKMTGAEFGKYLAKETGKGGNVIKANPEQSKHLETLTINLFGQDVDFVNLRSESYGDSRIPEMQFGTPEVDAQRRDLTINALFYNVNEHQVEDFTGKGVEDLKTMTLRTPLEPEKTFTDDPLRILRMLRFYSRYPGATLDPSAVEAMKNPDVLKALKKKVSPERMLTELKKMFAGKQQAEALQVLHDTGIWTALFSDRLKGREVKVPDPERPGEFKMEPAQELRPFTMDQKNKYHVDNVLQHTLKVVKEYDAILRADGAGDDERANALMAAFLHDLGKLDPSIIGIKETAEGIFQSYHGHEDVSEMVTRSILEALKASNEEVEYIAAIVKNHMTPHNKMTDKQIRKLMRNLGKNLLRRVIQHAKADAKSKPGADEAHYDDLLRRTETLEPSAPDNNPKKPPISGEVLMAKFPNLKPASGFIRDINDRLQDMLDENPALTPAQLEEQVEIMRPEIEAKYRGFTSQKRKPQQQQPKPVAPPQAVPQPVAPPTAPQPPVTGSWYNRSVKEARDTADQVCGRVVKKPFAKGSKSDHQAIMLVLDDGTGEYVLRRTGENPFHDPELEKLVGRSICAKGLIHGYIFLMSTWTHQPDREQEGVTYMERDEPQDLTQFQAGDSVRRRNKGLAFPQVEGKITRIVGDLMYIKWDGIKEEEVIKLTDTVALHGLIAKA
jgi:tRNA nucleotidyltransferase/poly(A) polymerase